MTLATEPATSRTSDHVLQRLSLLHPKLIDLSLGRMERLLAALGHPERRLPPVVHVAGTNGKGSVVATLRAMAEAAGQRVHVYTSPHLVRFHERIRLAGTLIDETALAALLDEVEAANAGEPITFFEVTTAAAFLAYSRVPADLLLLEVGLGGRLDATNVVERPAACIITSVSIDHAEFLGPDARSIASEKAGIARPGVPLVVAPQAFPEALATILAHADAVGAPAFVADRDWSVAVRDGRLCYRDANGLVDLPQPRLVGRHQVDNAGTAIACARHITALGLDQAALRAGLERVDWPARMQRLDGGRLAALLPPGCALWLDGGHNPAAGEALAQVLRGLEAGPTAMVVAMLATKDVAGFLAPFAALGDLAPQLVAIDLPGDHATTPAATIAAHATALGLAATTAADLPAALRAAGARAGAGGRVLIAGSLYLAGHALALNG
ncbi:bifunctional folylpolyglutamate synthase/dihydrofolate synthase [Zavarzinia sp. CC-PAN008]|uniref:bifunctional folylpolyglutamate synthase/dihydrofolate synthase n=1 Tax=Zavarzinia sp. CC-PAN008 TaxID=3243332 RepID=UPI003F7483E0